MKNPCECCVVSSCCTRLCSNKKVYNYIALAESDTHRSKLSQIQLKKTIKESKAILVKKYPESVTLALSPELLISILKGKRIDNVAYDFCCQEMLQIPPKEIQNEL